MHDRWDDLSGKQRKLWRFLREYRAQHGYGASRAECAAAINVSPGNIDHHLNQLMIRKWIEITPRKQRGIKVLRDGVPTVDAATGEGLDETDPDRPRMDSIAELLGDEPSLLVWVGNDAMAGIGIGRGDCVALAPDYTPDHGDVVAAEIDGRVEVRRFVHTQTGNMLATEPEKWTGEETTWTRAEADNVTILGVELACVTMPEGRKRREREMAQALKRRGRGIER